MVLSNLDSYTPKNETGSLFIPYTNIYSKWSKDVKGRPETVSILEENICSKLLDIGLSDCFFFFFFGSDSKGKVNKNKNTQDYVRKQASVQ